MKTKVSAKGYVVLPCVLRRKLGLHPGDLLEAQIEGGRIVLTPQRRRRHKTRILIDPITGLPGLSVGPDGPVLSSRDVQETLANFP